MEFVSYAQNYEDVVLWRALGDVRHGFYVDVGAGDPEADSVTLAFYERGWSGVNIEPLPEFHQRLQAARTRDTNLQLAVAKEPGCRTIHLFGGTGLSTLSDQIAERHTKNGHTSVDLVVPALPLSTIFSDQDLETVHFLKIDAEGAEEEILLGMDLGRWRPWIVLVEATEPNSVVSTRNGWEQLIVQSGYLFAYFDGLNCFYVAREHSDLKEKLSLPPNYFDNFVRVRERVAIERVAELEISMRKVEDYTRSVERAVEERDQHLHEVRLSDLERHRNELQGYAERLYNLLRIQNEQQEWRERLLQRLDQGIQVRNELSALVAVVDALGRRFDKPPSQFRVDLATFRTIGDRVTGGGVRSLAKRILRPVFRSLARLPWAVSCGRILLKPFPGIGSEIWRLSLPADPVRNPNVELTLSQERPSAEELKAVLTGPARNIFQRLRRKDLGDNDPR